MQTESIITGEQLANALRALGVNFILGGEAARSTLDRQPVQLLSALAESKEARLRLSLIPLFLEHPEFAGYARAAAKKLDPSARLTLQCYYSAAVLLEIKYQPGKKRLPEYFSKELALDYSGDPNENLRRLAKRHAELSGEPVNWLGTYEHAVRSRYIRSGREE